MKVTIYNTALNPDIWDNYVLKSSIRQSLIQIAYDFYKSTDLRAPIVDIYLVGSLANFNWSKSSDLDVHLVIDFAQIDDNRELVEKYVNSLKSAWNSEHDIHLHGYNVEVYIQDISKKNRSSGVYSLVKGDWISKPQKEDFYLDIGDIQNKYQDIVVKIRKAINEHNIERLKQVLKDIYDMRNTGLDRGGEMSTENLVFKILRNRGHLKALKDAVASLYDDQFTV